MPEGLTALRIQKVYEVPGVVPEVVESDHGGAQTWVSSSERKRGVRSMPEKEARGYLVRA